MIEGHDEAIRAFFAAMRGERPHHAWLFAGQKGVGKASAAARLAARLLAEAAGSADADMPAWLPETHGTERLIAARSHPDFRMVEREVWQKNNRDKLVPYDERKAEDEPARNIRVAQIRWLEPMLALAPSMSDRRFIVIDAADDLEPGAANALLKMLEEPPTGTTFLLVSHAPGRLLPTIRSRCRALSFTALDDIAMAKAIARHLPDARDEERAALIAAGKGSPGRAIANAGLELGAIEKVLADIAAGGDRDNALRSGLATSLSAKNGQKRYEAFLTRVPHFIASEARQRSGDALAAALDAYDRARALAESAVRQSLDVHLTVFNLGTLVASLAAPRDAAKA